MIETARASLEDFLKANLHNIKKDTKNLIPLRRVWLELNKEYAEYDLNLDVEWEGLSGYSGNIYDIWCGCCGTAPKGPHAKSFKVVIKNWDAEKTIEANDKTDNLLLRSYVRWVGHLRFLRNS